MPHPPRRTPTTVACTALLAFGFAGAATVRVVPTAAREPAVTRAAEPAAALPCAFESAPAPVPVAFCDSFQEGPTVNPPGSRSGQLNGALWGVSRQLGYDNLGQQQYDAGVTSLQIGGTCPSSPVTIETDVRICHGVLDDVVNDNTQVTVANTNQVNGNGTVTSLAMYPKQPFDFAGRTGTVVFDVSDDSGGMHTSWPEFWVTSAPTPDPFVHFNSWQAVPQFGFGLRLGGVCSPAGTGPGSGGGNCGPDCPSDNTGYVVTVASAIVVNNYTVNDTDSGDTPPQNLGTLKYVPDGCVTEPTAPGQMNHFEVRVSQQRIDVYATDAFTPPFNPARERLVHLGTVTNPDLGFTRGLIWLEDVHYNANKGIDTKLQALHTFSWANVGFDGPLLPRDLAFDVPDANEPTPGYPTLDNLGWRMPDNGTPLALTVPGVHGTAAAHGALLTLNYEQDDPATLTYRVNNGSWQTEPWPFGACAVQNGLASCGQRTIALTVPLTDVRAGNDTVQILSSQPSIVSNVDLVLRGAGGVVPPTPPTACPDPLPVPVSGSAVGVAAMQASLGSKTCHGYWVATRSGSVTAVGAAHFFGDLAGHHLAAPIVSITPAPDGGGYYLVGSDGGVYAFGDAHFAGSTGAMHLTKPIVGMSVAPGGGYWLVGSDGGIFAFGHARFHGSMGAVHLTRPVVGMAADARTGGYWLVASDGGVFAFDAAYRGSAADLQLAHPIVGISPQPDGRGYRLVGSDGGVFDYGDATYYGSLPGRHVASPDVTGLAPSVDGLGYYLINAAGEIWAFGDAPYLGNA
jgi:hypothetical protein